MPDFALETELGAARGKIVIGLDEAGRGPWAGPVVAAAVWLAPERLPAALLARLDDSKALTPAAREALHAELARCTEAGPDGGLCLALGSASVAEIDRLNILQASLLAMRRAADGLAVAADAALVDGNRPPELACTVRTVVKGDRKCLTIAAASIAAKVTRDRMMDELARRHPGYGWESNRGYGTAAHRAALEKLGVTPEHRRSFRPVRESLSLTG